MHHIIYMHLPKRYHMQLPKRACEHFYILRVHFYPTQLRKKMFTSETLLLCSIGSLIACFVL